MEDNKDTGKSNLTKNIPLDFNMGKDPLTE
jgi:hypothetical protein